MILPAELEVCYSKPYIMYAKKVETPEHSGVNSTGKKRTSPPLVLRVSTSFCTASKISRSSVVIPYANQLSSRETLSRPLIVSSPILPFRWNIGAKISGSLTPMVAILLVCHHAQVATMPGSNTCFAQWHPKQDA